jgi:hypothetical protein
VTAMISNVTASYRLSRVDALDLEPIVFKLMHPEPEETALSVISAYADVTLYRCFLKLCVLYPGTTIVPTRHIDHVWHAHMLDTARYRADCDSVLGAFLDHYPYAGLRGEADRRAWRKDFVRTRRLFREHFGVDIGGQPAASACNNHGDGAQCIVGCVTPPQRPALPPQQLPSDVN